MTARILALLTAVSLLASPASAHPGAQALHGFAGGFAHPLGGLDHVLAMLAVGLWAGLVGGRALWAWPLAFLGVMVGGALLGLAGIPLLGAETVIALSVLLFGLAVAARVSLPVFVGGLLTGVFALFHGFAHGAELPAGADLTVAVAGFSAATALLHGAGICMVLGSQGLSAAWLPRAAGGAVALSGLALLMA
jgi:urease accessory protein